MKVLNKLFMLIGMYGLVVLLYMQYREMSNLRKEREDLIDIVQVCNQRAREKIEVLKRIIDCESSGRLDIVSETGDHGALQVNKIHRQRAKELFNFDIVKNPVDSFLYGLYLYETEGGKHWKASQKCWEKAKKVKK